MKLYQQQCLFLENVCATCHENEIAVPLKEATSSDVIRNPPLNWLIAIHILFIKALSRTWRKSFQIKADFAGIVLKAIRDSYSLKPYSENCTIGSERVAMLSQRYFSSQNIIKILSKRDLEIIIPVLDSQSVITFLVFSVRFARCNYLSYGVFLDREDA